MSEIKTFKNSKRNRIAAAIWASGMRTIFAKLAADQREYNNLNDIPDGENNNLLFYSAALEIKSEFYTYIDVCACLKEELVAGELDEQLQQVGKSSEWLGKVSNLLLEAAQVAAFEC